MPFTDKELLLKASKFTFNAIPEDIRNESDETHHFDVYVDYRGPNSWAVTNRFGSCYNANLEEQYESLPSTRTDEFKKEFRFTLEEACEIAEKLSHIVTITGRMNAQAYTEWWRGLKK